MPEQSQPNSHSAARVLDLVTLLTLGLALFLRTTAPGQDTYEVMTALVEVITWMAASLWFLSCVAKGAIVLPGRALPIFQAAILAAALVAVRTAANGSDEIQASLMAYHWGMDFLLSFAILAHAHTHERRAFLLSMLAASCAVIATYSIYQGFFGLDYFRNVLQAKPDLVANSAGNDPVQQEQFWIRVNSTRIFGPYGYSNTLAGFFIMTLPLLCLAGLKSLKDAAATQRIMAAATLALGAVGIVDFVWSGSKGGFLAAKACELFAVWLLCRIDCQPNQADKHRPQSRLGDSFATIFLFSLVEVAAKQVGGAVLGVLPSDMLMAAIWLGEICLLIKIFNTGLPRIISRTMAAISAFILVAACAGAIWLLAGMPGLSTSKAETANNAALNAWRNVEVRYNYWVAAGRMIEERPLLGMGLDAFGSYYTQYKTLEGWAVKRVHNVYLQLLTDGGIVLLAPWLIAWIYVFCKGRKPEELPMEEPSADESRDKLRANMAVGGVAILLLGLFIALMLNGFSIEFFWNEFFQKAHSSWPANKLPGLIHLLAHVLAMPLAGAAAFLCAWKWLNREESLRPAAAMLLAGLAGMMLHFIVDFHYHCQVISSLAWAMAALLLLTPKKIQVRIPASALGAAISLACLAGLMAFGWLKPISQWSKAYALEVADTMGSMDCEKTLAIYADLLKQCPTESMLNRKAADLLRKQIFDAAAQAAERSGGPNRRQVFNSAIIASNPAARARIIELARASRDGNQAMAATHAFLGRSLAMLFPNDREKLREALSAFTQASARHPYQCEYHVWIGRLNAVLGNAKEAEAAFAKALEMDSKVGDDQAKLQKPDKQETEAYLENVRRQQGNKQ